MTGALFTLAMINCLGSSVGIAELARHEHRFDAGIGRTLGRMALWLLIAGTGFLLLSKVA